MCELKLSEAEISSNIDENYPGFESFFLKTMKDSTPSFVSLGTHYQFFIHLTNGTRYHRITDPKLNKLAVKRKVEKVW